MPKAHLIRTDLHPYHITSRCQHKRFFHLPLYVVWRVMLDELYISFKENGLAIHAFVLMGNHFHLLCHTPKANLDQIMQRFLRRTSIRLARTAGESSSLWDDRYRWSLIDSQTHYYQVYRYIYQNPLRAGIVKKVEDYPFSTLRGEFSFPLQTFVPLSFGGEEGELIWLNERFDPEEAHLIKLGLKHSQFDLNKKRLKALMKIKSTNKLPSE